MNRMRSLTPAEADSGNTLETAITPISAPQPALVEDRAPPGYFPPTARDNTTSMGKYRAFLELGQGGTAVVFLGVSKGPGGFNKLVVLKMLKRGLANQTEFRRMFLSEARLSARLNHPNIVQVYEVTERNRVPIIVMEYLEGKPLSEIRGERDGQVPLPLQLRVLADGLLGLHYSHDLKDFDGSSLDVVHRDFTPHNLFVTYDGQVKVLDFGIAKLSGSLVETETGVIKGKLRYMPPEQVLGNRVDRRADIFAAGVIMWETITGKRMWSDLPEAAILNRISRGEIPSPTTANPDVPEALANICMRAIAPNVDDRYASAAEFRAALEDWLRASGHAISGTDVADYMTTHFAEFRLSTRQAVEHHLSAARLSSAEEEGDDAVLLPASTGLEQSQPAASQTVSQSMSSQGATASVSLTGAAPTSARGWWLAVIGALLFAASAWLVWSRPRPEATTAPTPSSPLAGAPATVELSVTAVPATAALSLDGVRLAGNPYRGRVPRDARQHLLAIEAQGYVSQTLPIMLDESRSVSLSLSLAQPEPAPPHHSGPMGPSPTRKTPLAAKARPDASAPATHPSPTVRAGCVPPYTIDANGFKVYKPACL